MTLADFFLRNRIERIISGARLVLACVALIAVWADPNQPAGLVVPTYLLLAVYLAFSLLVLARGMHILASGARALVLHAVDLGVFTFLLAATDGPSSPFFLLFIFSLVAGAFRWGWKGALGTGIAVLALVAGNGIAFLLLSPQHGAELDRLILRFANVAVVASMLAVFFYYQERMTSDLRRLSAWRTEPGPSDLESMLRRWMERVAAVFGSDRVVVVLDDPEEPLPVAAIWSEGKLVRRPLPDIGADRIVRPSADRSIFVVRPDESAVLLDAAGKLVRCRESVLDPGLLRTLDLSATISAPIESQAIRGRIFITKPERSGPEDLMIAGLVAEQLGAALDRITAVDATRRAAASEERLRLARDLHDGVLQTLAGMALQLENLTRDAGGSATLMRTRIRAVQAWLIEEQREMRAFIRSLRPESVDEFDYRPLAPALAALCKSLERQWGIECRLEIVPPQMEMPALLDFHLRHIVREAAANAARHGSATVLEIVLSEKEDELHVSISDNGGGLPVHGRFGERECQEASIGPQSLRERVSGLGGHLELVSSSAGLRLEIDLPTQFGSQAA